MTFLCICADPPLTVVVCTDIHSQFAGTSTFSSVVPPSYNNEVTVTITDVLPETEHLRSGSNSQY